MTFNCQVVPPSIHFGIRPETQILMGWFYNQAKIGSFTANQAERGGFTAN
jgi:hypothetical protein